MNWIKFALLLCGSYGVYYFGIILWDVLRGRSPGSLISAELTFTEHFDVKRPEPEPVVEMRGSAMVSSGGVSLQQLFMLAREEAIEYTRPVSF